MVFLMASGSWYDCDPSLVVLIPVLSCSCGSHRGAPLGESQIEGKGKGLYPEEPEPSQGQLLGPAPQCLFAVPRAPGNVVEGWGWGCISRPVTQMQNSGL